MNSLYICFFISPIKHIKMANETNLVKEVQYLDTMIKIYKHNRLPVNIPAHEFEKLVNVCNQTGKTISQVIRLQSQPCCECHNKEISFINDEGETVMFTRVSMNSKKRRTYFKKNKQ